MAQRPSDDEHLARLRTAEQRIKDHPAFQEHSRLEAFRRTLFEVFYPNLCELLALLEQPTRDVKLAIELVQNAHAPTIREQFWAVTGQRLHNHVAAVGTVVDHARRLQRGRTGPLAKEFEERRQRFCDDGEHAFMHGLRDFTLHRALPLLASSFSVTAANTPEAQRSSEVELGVSHLTEWENWPAAAQRYLQRQGEVVVLRPVIRRHGAGVLELNRWLLAELKKANDSLLHEVDELIIDHTMVLTGADRATAARLVEERSQRGATPAQPPATPQQTEGSEEY